MRKMEVLSPVLFAIYVDDVARCCKNERYLHIILYADDILLLAGAISHSAREVTPAGNAKKNSVNLIWLLTSIDLNNHIKVTADFLRNPHV